ncbi:MAG: sodium-dependent transporter [Endomicrobiales bacterium]|nr:sodium-dependent transporter [Endomicrobiales bacterium]
MSVKKDRENWGSRLGIIMAVAGSAVGLGNFLRFPVQAANNGGGAFMIPYLVSLLLLGIPLMWIEWTAGRFGGGFGHGTAPGIFNSMWEKNRFIKYFGVIGIFGPIVIFIYYAYIESWLLAYSFFSLTGKLSSLEGQAGMQSFLSAYQGLVSNEHFSGIGTAYLFFLITFVVNTWVIYKGISGGIEKLCKWAMPVLLVFGVILAVRVLTLGTPDPAKPGWNLANGLGFLWNPDFSALKNSKVWLAAAGQVFFTLSVGIGVILTYASYLKKHNDVALSGLTSASTNEFAEVILGGSIVIPAAFVFFGPEQIVNVAQSGAFNLGFVTMPLIFQKIAWGSVFAFMWFMLLFLAGITSSISLAQPAISFLEDEFNVTKKEAVMIFATVTFVLCQASVFLLGHGVVDELDFWGGTFCLVLFATIETILFSWVFGIDRAWDEMHSGADIRIPKLYKYVIKYVTPLFLVVLLVFWLLQQGIPTVLMSGVPDANRYFILMTRLVLFGMVALLAVLVNIAWRHRAQKKTT